MENTETDPQRRRGRFTALLIAALAVLTAAVAVLGVTMANQSANFQRLSQNSSETTEPLRQLSKAQGSLTPSFWRGDLEGSPGAIELEIRRGGKVIANDGCNGGWGSWHPLGNGEIGFGTFVSTLRGCLGVEDLWLYDAVRGELSRDGDTMYVYGEADELLGELHRVKAIPRSNEEDDLAELRRQLSQAPKFRAYFFHHGYRNLHSHATSAG